MDVDFFKRFGRKKIAISFVQWVKSLCQLLRILE